MNALDQEEALNESNDEDEPVSESDSDNYYFCNDTFSEDDMEIDQ